WSGADAAGWRAPDARYIRDLASTATTSAPAKRNRSLRAAPTAAPRASFPSSSSTPWCGQTSVRCSRTRRVSPRPSRGRRRGHWLPQERQARRVQLRQGQQHLDRQLDRLTEAYLSAVIPLAEYQQRRRTLEAHQAALKQQAEQLEYQATHHQELAGWVTSVTAFCLRVQAGLAQATFEQRRQLVELLIDRVVVTDEVVEIRYVIPTTSASEHVRFCHLRTLYFQEGELAQMVDVAERMTAADMCAIGLPAVVDAHTSELRQDANRLGRLMAALGMDRKVRQPARARDMRPGQGPCPAHAGLVAMQDGYLRQRQFNLRLHWLQGRRRPAHPLHQGAQRERRAEEIGQHLTRAAIGHQLLLHQIDG